MTMLTRSLVASAVASLVKVDATFAARLKGSTILITAEEYVDELLTDDAGWNQWKGECATGVQYVCFKAGLPIGPTEGWREGTPVVTLKDGERVLSDGVFPGTPIATFRNGRYAEDHAAIFVKKTDTGLLVWDQFKNTASGKPKHWGIRQLSFMGPDDLDRSNNGDLFSVIDR